MKTILLDGLWGAAWRLTSLRNAIERSGLGPAEIFSYDSSGFTKLEDLAHEFAFRHAGQPLRVVAHSMGGLIVRLAKLYYPGLDLRAAAFLCVPHRGSLMARLLPFPAVRQMRPGSALLGQLAGQRWEVPTLAVWCAGDLMVVPGSSAIFEPAIRTLCCRVPLHNWPLVWPGWHQVVADFFHDVQASQPECVFTSALP